MREKQVEKILVDGVRVLGGVAYKFVSPGNDGVPDRIVVLPYCRPAFVELKTEAGRLSPRQKVQIERLDKMGQPVYVLHGPTEVRDFLDQMALVRAEESVKRL